jgi:hypothetical protein
MKNTNRGFIIPLVIIVIAAVAIGGGAYTYSKKSMKVKDNTNVNAEANANVKAQENANENSAIGVKASGTLKDLFALKTAQVCTVSLTGGQYSGGNGTVYVASGKMRSDFNATVDGKTYNTHIIVKDNVSYTWIDGMEAGFKMAVNNTAKPQGSSSQAPDMDQKVNYDCKAWTEEGAKFIAPASIKFNDLSTIKIPANVNINNSTNVTAD